MKLFQISMPRSRSTFLFESTKEWQKNRYGLLEVDRHPELFLEWGRNMELHDRKTDDHYTSELYPIIKDDTIRMHFVWPPILGDTSARNHYKLQLLKQEKLHGREYIIKGTLNFADNCEEIFNFFNDRKIILTTRNDKEAMMMSFFFAWETKLFQARANNIEYYQSVLQKGVVVSKDIVYDYIPFVQQFDKIKTHLEKNNIKFTILTYEDMADHTTISETLGTDEWRRFCPSDGLSFHIEKDYTTLIHNYDEIKELLIEENII